MQSPLNGPPKFVEVSTRLGMYHCEIVSRILFIYLLFYRQCYKNHFIPGVGDEDNVASSLRRETFAAQASGVNMK